MARIGIIHLSLLIGIGILLIGSTQAEEEPVEYEEDEGFCTTLDLLKKKVKRKVLIAEHETMEKIPKIVDRVCPEFIKENLAFFLSLFAFIAWGAFVRTILRITNLNIPYTVVLLISGLIIGLGTRIPGQALGHPEPTNCNLKQSFCSFWSTYTKIARTAPEIILYTFLPVLIFESAFNMEVHIFLRSAWQIIVVALPGMLITTFITAAVCQQFMHSYQWTFTEASLFGSIISATDPVAVVAILRDLGTSDTLSTIIEGESLLNDGVAILLYEIFKDIVSPEKEGEGDDLITGIVVKFIKISLGGPLLGVVAAKIAVTCLSKIFNDGAVEITITLVAAYLTYYTGETLHVSGVVAVVVLGIRMNADHTSISPEVEDMVHHFWEMLGYLANTVLFVLVGIVITETAINHIDLTDLLYLAFFYVAVNIVRLLMLMVLMPWLSRIGYGLKWRDMITMMWGGLRGAVGLCLSLEVYRNKEMCESTKDKLGPKFLFHTAGIVILTLIVNGTTTKLLLRALGMTTISAGRMSDMATAVKQIIGAQIRTLALLKHDRFLADANWDMVDKYTEIEDPYAKPESEKNRKQSLDIIPRSVASTITMRLSIVPEESEVDYGQPTIDEFRIMTEEARIRFLNAMKVSFFRQFEQGLLTEISTQILSGAVEVTVDKELHMIHARDFKLYFTVHGFYNWVRIHVIKYLGLDAPVVYPPEPESRCRHPFWTLCTRDWIEGLVHLIVLLNLIPIIWDVVYQLQPTPERDDLRKRNDSGTLTPDEKKTLDQMEDDAESHAFTFLIINIAFTVFYFIELVCKHLGFGFKGYWSSKWNWLDAFILVVSIIDIIVSIFIPRTSVRAIRLVVQILRFGRISRSFRLFRPLMPKIYAYIDERINDKLFLGYDVGKGFITAVDDVLKFLPQIVEHPRVLHKLKTALEHERLEAVRAMGLLQKEHHRIAIGVKTRHASRAVLNQMRDTLEEMKEEGLLDEKEGSILNTLLEEKMKRLWNAPSSINPSSPEALLRNVIWMLNNEDISKFMVRRAQLVELPFGDTITMAGSPPDGVFVVISGMVKVNYKPKDGIVHKCHRYGVIPNADIFTDLTFDTEATDYFSTGTVIGELGVLTDTKSDATVTCETDVVAYHIPDDSMKDALRQFIERNDSLEARLWRSFGMRISAALLPSRPAFQTWSLPKIRMVLERSAVPIGERFDTMSFPEFIAHVVLIYGQVEDAHTREIYTAPYLLPTNCTKIIQVAGAPTKGRVLLIAHEDIDHEHSDSLHDLHDTVTIGGAARHFSVAGAMASPSLISMRNRRLSQYTGYTQPKGKSAILK